MPKFQNQKPRHNNNHNNNHFKGKNYNHNDSSTLKPQILIAPKSFPDIRYKKTFWLGTPGDDEPSTEVKEQRKNLGILVKGKRLSLCPPPLTEVSEVGLTPECKKLLTSLNIIKPSVIQMQAWPAILSGSDVLGIAPTGSGKSLAFMLPMIPHILHRFKMISTSNQTFKGPPGMAIVLVPTRELCMQIANYIKPLSKLFGINSCCFYGGQDKDTQMSVYRANGGAHVLVCTPGRLLDFISDKQVNLSHITYVVLDESDRMLSLGFEEQLNQILGQIRPDRQTVLFSASFPGRLREAASRWMTDEVVIRCNTLEVSGPPRDASEKVKSSSNAEEVDTAAGTEPGRVKGKRELVVNEGDDMNTTNVDSTDGGATTVVSQTVSKKQKKVTEPDNEDYSQIINEQQQKQSSNNDEDYIEENDNVDPTSATSSSSSVAVSSTIVQTVHVCASHKKPRLFLHFIERLRKQEKEESKRQLAAILVFCTKIKTIGFVMDFLKRHNQSIGVGMLHGNMMQSEREKTLEHFRAVSVHIYIYIYILFV